MKTVRVLLTISPDSIAARVPITPEDTMTLKRCKAGLKCFVQYSAESVEIKEPDGHFAGFVVILGGQSLPEDKHVFKAVAASTGNAYEVPLRVKEAKRPLCIACGKPLPKIGYARENGADHMEWESREYHKKCWKALK